MSTLKIKIHMDDYQKDVLVHIDDGIESNYSDDDIFYYYETFEEIVQNNAIDFDVLEVDGTDINEFI
jgi:predicted transcriptional regulator